MPGSSRSITDPRNAVIKPKTPKTKTKLSAEEFALLKHVVLAKYNEQRREALLRAIKREQAKLKLPTGGSESDREDDPDRFQTTTAGGRGHYNNASFNDNNNNDNNDDNFDDYSLSSHESLFDNDGDDDEQEEEWYVCTENRVITIYCERKQQQQQQDKERALQSAKALIDKVLLQHQQQNHSPRRALSRNPSPRGIEKNVALPPSSAFDQKSKLEPRTTTTTTTTRTTSQTNGNNSNINSLPTVVGEDDSKLETTKTTWKAMEQPVKPQKTSTCSETPKVSKERSTAAAAAAALPNPKTCSGLSTKDRIALWNKMAQHSNKNNSQQQ